MRAGKLDRQIVIQRATVTGQDEYGADILKWVDLATVFAQQRPNRGAERLTALQVDATNVLTFHIRHFPDLSASDLVSYEDRIWDIKDIRELGRRSVTEIDVLAQSN